jgi:hypothetical protein
MAAIEIARIARRLSGAQTCSTAFAAALAPKEPLALHHDTANQISRQLTIHAYACNTRSTLPGARWEWDLDHFASEVTHD